MRFITLLRQASGTVFFFAVVTSVLSGVFSTYVVSLVHAFVNEGIENDPYYAFKFFGSTLLFGLTGVLSTYLISILTQNMIFQLRTELSAQVLKASFQKSERNLNKILPVLTADINFVAESMSRLPPVTTALAVAAGCMSYLFFLSWKLTLISSVFFFLVFLINYLSLPYLKKCSEDARNVWDQIYKNFEGIVYGMKELKLSKAHRDIYLSQKVRPNCAKEKKFRLKEDVFYAFSTRGVEVLWLSGIGIFTVFIGNFNWIDKASFTGYLIVLVFMVSPLSIVTGYLKHLKRTQISLEKIDRLGVRLEKEPDFNTRLPEVSNWDEKKDSIFSFDEVYFSYDSSKERDRFAIGPINLQLKKGELIYITGGNGTGKTTLTKLLVGLYVPNSGQVIFKGVSIGEKELDAYRTHFAAVFTDNYLFDDLLHIDPAKIESDTAELLEKLEIGHKVSIRDQRLSTTKLSYGQRKRLAMLVSILEDKEIYVFDEWAANQDAYFKDVFYVKLLPELKEKGKTIIAVSHDEKYFEYADRVFEMADGQLSEIRC